MGAKHGQGRVFRRSSDGRWIGKVPDGTGGHRYVTATTEAEAKRRLTALRKAMGTSSSPGGGRLLDHVERWFRDVAPGRYRGRTAATNEAQARLHILPMLGRFRLTEIRPSDVQRMLDAMSARGYAAQTVINVAHILSVVMRDAEADGIIPRNPVRLVRLPKRERPNLPSLSTPEVQRFLDATRGEPMWPAWALAFATGIRVGELCGLRWADWDREARTLTIDGQWQRMAEPGRVRYVRRPGKTANSRRMLHLPALGTEALTVQLAQATSAVVMFATPQGHPRHPTHVSRTFRESLAAHGFPHVRLHSLRHAAAVAMLDQSGGDVVAVSKVLGHSTLSITVDTYGQEADEARKRGATYMDLALTKKPATEVKR